MFNKQINENNMIKLARGGEKSWIAQDWEIIDYHGSNVYVHVTFSHNNRTGIVTLRINLRSGEMTREDTRWY